MVVEGMLSGDISLRVLSLLVERAVQDGGICSESYGGGSLPMSSCLTLPTIF